MTMTWITAEKGLRRCEIFTNVWGWDGEKVEKFFVDFDKGFYLRDNMGGTTRIYDANHQPTHVMIRRFGSPEPAFYQPK